MGVEAELAEAVLPGANVAGSDDRLARATEQARQVEALIASSLHIVRELHHYDVGHRVAKLKVKGDK